MLLYRHHELVDAIGISMIILVADTLSMDTGESLFDSLCFGNRDVTCVIHWSGDANPSWPVFVGFV